MAHIESVPPSRHVNPNTIIAGALVLIVILLVIIALPTITAWQAASAAQADETARIAKEESNSPESALAYFQANTDRQFGPNWKHRRYYNLDQAVAESTLAKSPERWKVYQTYRERLGKDVEVIRFVGGSMGINNPNEYELFQVLYKESGDNTWKELLTD